MQEVKLLNSELFASIDDADFNKITQHQWTVSIRKGKIIGVYYGKRLHGKYHKIALHRYILDITDPQVFIDHIDGNPLNNQKKNLRVCTNAENCRNTKISKANTSGYKGVRWHKRDKVFEARIGFNKKLYHLGRFKDPKEAAKAYDNKAKELFGEFAKSNEELIKNV